MDNKESWSTSYWKGIVSLHNRTSLTIVSGLCLFIAFLSFKPSEPYLSQYLICNRKSAEDYCSSLSDATSCKSSPCVWAGTSCVIEACNNVTGPLCGDDDYNYCELSSDQCVNAACYEYFSENQVNNGIYPWSTYAYLPFLLLLGPFAELVSYRTAILFGIVGRVVTRALLLYGKSLLDMQMMQVSYSLGTAAEDVFSAYVYYVVSIEDYQTSTSAIKAAALISCMLSGILGDVLVVEFDTSLKVLMWISAAFVWAGFVLGFFVLRPPTSNLQPNNRFWSDTQNQTSKDGQCVKYVDIQPGISRAIDSDVESRRTAESKSSQNPLVSEEHDILSEQNREVISNPRHYFNSAVENSSHSVVHEHDGGKVDLLAEPGFSKQPSSESVRNLSAEPISSSYLTMQGKMRLFFRQVRCLRHSLKSGVVQAMLLYWIFGNAVFQTLYDYEVSLYQEWRGDNTWNGSVLAVMLVAGSMGAVLPAYLDDWQSLMSCKSKLCRRDRNMDDSHDALLNHRTSSDAKNFENTVSETIVSFRLNLAGVLASLTLAICAVSWHLWISVASLAFYFAAWQFINVIVYARFAMYLKRAEIHLLQEQASSEPIDTKEITFAQNSVTAKGTNYERIAGNTDSPRSPSSESDRINESAVEAPYSLAIVLIIAVNVLVQIILQSVLFSGLQLSLRSAFVCLTFVFIGATAMYIVATITLFGMSVFFCQLCR